MPTFAHKSAYVLLRLTSTLYVIQSAELERKLHLTESKYAELERSTDQWKARVEAIEQQLKAVTADRGASCALCFAHD